MFEKEKNPLYKVTLYFILIVDIVFIAKRDSSTNLTIDQATEVINKTNQNIQLFGLIFGILIIVVLLMLIILPNKESLVRSSSPYKKEHKVFEAGVKNEKAKEVNVVLLKMIVRVIIGLMMIILAPKLIGWLINI